MKYMTILKHIRRLACIATVGIIGLALSSPAQADMTLTVEDVNTGTTTTIHDGGTGDVAVNAAFPKSLTFGNYTISQVSASANYDGNTDLNANTGDANVLNTVLRVTQSGSTGGSSDTLIVTVTTSGSASWSIPTGSPLLLTSTDSVSLSSAGVTSQLSSSLVSGVNTTVVTAPPTAGNVTTTKSGLAVNNAPPFYLNNQLTINTSSGQVVNLSDSTQAINPAPEPSTGILALSGGFLMLAFGWRQRRGVR
jgi:hypothetical protein